MILITTIIINIIIIVTNIDFGAKFSEMCFETLHLSIIRLLQFLSMPHSAKEGRAEEEKK